MEKIYLASLFLIALPLQAMDHPKEKVVPKLSPAQIARAFGAANSEDAQKSQFSDVLKAYRSYKTTVAQDFLCQRYDAADGDLRSAFDKLLHDASLNGGASLNEEIHPIEQIRSDEVRATGNVTKDFGGELEEGLARKKLEFLKMLLSLEENEEASRLIIQYREELRNTPIKSIRTELAQLASPAVKRVTSITPPPAAINNETQMAFIKANVARGRGMFVLTLDQLQKFGKFWELYNDGSGLGRTEGSPILTGKELQSLLDLEKALYIFENKALAILLDFLEEELRVDLLKCAKLIQQVDDLKIETLFGVFIDFFMDLIVKKVSSEGSVAVYSLLVHVAQQVQFSERVQKELACRFFSQEDCIGFLARLHSYIDGEKHTCIHSGPRSVVQMVTDEHCKLIDVSTRKQLFSCPVPLGRYGALLCEVPFLVAWNDENVTLMEYNGNILQTIDCFKPNSVVVSPNKQMVALLCKRLEVTDPYNDLQLILWDITTGRYSEHKLDSDSLSSEAAAFRSDSYKVAFSSDSSAVMVVRGGRVECWDLLARIGDSSLATRRARSDEHKGMITFLTASPCGHFITSDDNGEMIVWSKQGALVSRHKMGGRVLCVDSTGHRFVVLDAGTCKLFDIPAQQEEQEQATCIKILEQDDVTAACFSRDSMLLALVRGNGEISLCNAKSGKLLTNLTSTADTLQVFFTANGQHILSTGEKLVIWHFLDDRLSFIKDDKDFVDAFLYAHCYELLRQDPQAVRRIAPALLEKRTAKSALLALAGIGNGHSFEAPSGAVPANDARPPEQNQGTILDKAEAEAQAEILYKEACVLREEKKYSEAIVQFESLVKREKVLDVPIMAWSYLADCYNLSMPKTPDNDARRIECMHRFLNLTKGFSSAVKNKESSGEKKESSIINNNNK